MKSWACGGLLLQDKVIGEKSNKLFQDEEHLVFYNPDKPEDLLKKIENLINNPDQAEKIAENGYNLCHSKHTIKHRLHEILDWVISDCTNPQKYYSI